MTPMTELKPVSKEEAKKISIEMKEVADSVSAEVAVSMKSFREFITRSTERKEFSDNVSAKFRAKSLREFIKKYGISTSVKK